MRGPISKTITVKTNDPENPQVVLTLKARLMGSVRLFPQSRLHISTRSDREPVARLVVRKEPEEKGVLQVSGLEADVPWLEASARKVAESELLPGSVPAFPGDWVVEVRAEGELRGGQHTAQVQFRTGLSREPVVKVPVTVAVPPAVSFSPFYLVLRAPGAGKPAQGVATAVIREGVDPAGVVVETDAPGLKAELERVPDRPRSFRLKVSWEPTEATPDRRAFVTVKAAQESLKLPVRVAPPATAAAPQGS